MLKLIDLLKLLTENASRTLAFYTYARMHRAVHSYAFTFMSSSHGMEVTSLCSIHNIGTKAAFSYPVRSVSLLQFNAQDFRVTKAYLLL